MAVTLNSATVLQAIQNLLPNGTTIYWEGEVLPDPEPAQFVVLEAGFDTPWHAWGRADFNIKNFRIRIVTTTFAQRETLLDNVQKTLPTTQYRARSATRSTGKIGTPPNDRFEAVLTLDTIT